MNTLLRCYFLLKLFNIVNMGVLQLIIVFIIFFLMYIHVALQYEKPRNLEIYELDYKNKTHLQEICNVRQPVIFVHPENKRLTPPINMNVISSIEKDNGNTMNIYDANDFYKNIDDDDIFEYPQHVSLPFNEALTKIQNTDSNVRFFTEKNDDFIENSGLNEYMVKTSNVFFKPPYTAIQTFDIMTGTKGVGLPFRYHTNTGKYIHVSNGNIMVKMTMFKDNKTMNFNSINADFMGANISSINCWNPEKKDVSILKKHHFLEFQVLQNNVLYIPPYWIYSIQYLEDDVCLLEYNYKTYINVIAYPNNYLQKIQQIQQWMNNSIGQLFSKNKMEICNKKKMDNEENNVVLPSINIEKELNDTPLWVPIIDTPVWVPPRKNIDNIEFNIINE